MSAPIEGARFSGLTCPLEPDVDLQYSFLYSRLIFLLLFVS
jgi:hypothetical protein